ncbi:MAG: type II secretion system protein GspG [Alphaproteobacteria bacterium]|nr:type II secretion system protein GspG [Alphaproteobacteria bacterium]
MKPLPCPTSRSGFTLIEIMVVLVIIGVLIALVAPNVMGRPDEARITAAKADLRAIGSALDMYKLDNFNYPSTQQGLQALVSKPSGAKKSGYLKKLPVDPWGNPYQYLQPGTHGEYDLYSLGPNGKPGQRESDSMIGEWEL